MDNIVVTYFSLHGLALGFVSGVVDGFGDAGADLLVGSVALLVGHLLHVGVALALVDGLAHLVVLDLVADLDFRATFLPDE